MKKELLNEKWSSKYKKTINCKNPRGFSQKAHCNSKIKKENKMKNEKNFKEKISEMAARIAGSLKEDYEAEKINLPPTFLTKVNSSIVTSKNMAQFLLDIIDEVSVGEPTFKKIESMTGFNTVIAALKRLSGITPGKEEVPDVSSTDKKDMELPQLQESFNRINRK